MHCLRPATVTATARDFVAGVSRRRAVCREVQSRSGGAARAVGRRRAAFRLRIAASEVRLVPHMFPDAAIHFMHPIKARGAIREAWARHGVRDFVLDSAAELAKIRDRDRRDRRAGRRSA